MNPLKFQKNDSYLEKKPVDFRKCIQILETNVPKYKNHQIFSRLIPSTVDTIFAFITIKIALEKRDCDKRPLLYYVIMTEY